MSYELRQARDYAFGTLSQAVAISDVALNSADFSSRLPTLTISSPYIPLVLQDPSTGNYEIVWVTVHTSAATSVTVVRAKEGTAARTWPSGTLWTVSPTIRDVLLPVPTRSALPTEPHVGIRCLIIDEGITVEWSASTGWAQSARTLAGRIATQVGDLHTLTTNTEVQVGKLDVIGKPITSGTFYDLEVGLSGNFSAAGLSVSVRVKQGASFGAATEIAIWSWLSAAGGSATHSNTWSKPWKATSGSASTNFYVSVQLITIPGTVGVNGNRRATFVITDRGSDSTVWTEVA